MMSSVIPARLEFQCGHAALVSLPRIKNESSAVRNQRVAREKTEALARRCDFCGPLLVEVVRTAPVAAAAVDVAPALSNGVEEKNGHHVAHAVLVAELMDGTPPAPAAEASPDAAPESIALVTAAPPLVEAAELPAEPSPVAPVTPTRSVQKRATAKRTRAAAIPVAAQAEAAPPVVAKALVAPKRTMVKRGRPANSARNTTSRGIQTTGGTRYTVRFLMQQVLRAADLQDALRQAGSLGAEEIVEIAWAG